MTCQEVVELMQRYLDADLDRAEYSAMMRHIQQCPECADMFERLKRLSEELEQLPKVVPPYSIVDAILPRLEQLDRQLAERHNAGFSGEAGPSAAETGDVEQKPARGQWRRKVSWGWVGGVVAAGIALGIAVFQEPAIRQNADGFLYDVIGKQQSAANSSAGIAKFNEPTAGSGSAEARLFASDESTERFDLQATESSVNDSIGPTHVAPQSDRTADDAATPLQKTAPVAPDAAPKSGRADAQIAPRASSDPANESAKTLVPDASSGGSGFGALSLPESIAAAPPAGGDSFHDVRKTDGAADAGEFVAGTSIPPHASPSDPSGRPAQGTADPPGSNYGQMSLPPANPGLSSPDGRYTAFVENRRVVIRDTDSGEVIYNSILRWREGDEIVLKDWDRQRLTYEVLSDDRVERIVIDVDEKTETGRSE